MHWHGYKKHWIIALSIYKHHTLLTGIKNGGH